MVTAGKVQAVASLDGIALHRQARIIYSDLFQGCTEPRPSSKKSGISSRVLGLLKILELSNRVLRFFFAEFRAEIRDEQSVRQKEG